jgi:hypothetical protein
MGVWWCAVKWLLTIMLTGGNKHKNRLCRTEAPLLALCCFAFSPAPRSHRCTHRAHGRTDSVQEPVRTGPDRTTAQSPEQPPRNLHPNQGGAYRKPLPTQPHDSTMLIVP